jgi:hypothetical protein
MSKTPTQRLAALYDSNPDRYGTTKLLGGTRDADGKTKSKSELDTKPLTAEVWERHTAGKCSIGCIPIKPDNTARWGAIDIDIYNEQFSLEDLQKVITSKQLPFVVCRSKSGGAHVYLFVKKPVAARLMIQKLETFAAYFGHAKTEIFPKQAIVTDKETDERKYGNWINMPYDGPDTLRYGFSGTGEPLLELEDFVQHAENRSLSPTAFKELDLPSLGKDAPLPGGPPCLNYIFAEPGKRGDQRNNALRAVVVYLKKADPDNVAKRLHEYNRMFDDPLDEREVESILKSYAKTNYKYSCADGPINAYCDGKLCKKQPFGIGINDFLPNNRTLVELMTTPVIWYLTIDDVEIQLTTEEFDNFTLFNRRVMETMRKKFPTMKPNDWADMQSLLLGNSTQVWIPKEMTPAGQLIELVGNYRNQASKDSDDVYRGKPHVTTEGDLVFGMLEFKSFLELNKFRELKSNEILGVIKTELKATQHTLRKDGTQKRCWRVSAAYLNDSADPDPIQIPEQQPY